MIVRLETGSNNEDMVVVKITVDIDKVCFSHGYCKPEWLYSITYTFLSQLLASYLLTIPGYNVQFHQ